MRIVKDPWRDGPVDVDRAALVSELPARQLVSVRLALDVSGAPAGKPMRSAPGTIVFRRGRDETGRVEGDAATLDLLEAIVAASPERDPQELLLPKDSAALAALVDGRAREVRSLLDEGRRLVEEVERLVCALYGLAANLTEAVVEHAAARTARSAR